MGFRVLLHGVSGPGEAAGLFEQTQRGKIPIIKLGQDGWALLSRDGLHIRGKLKQASTAFRLGFLSSTSKAHTLPLLICRILGSDCTFLFIVRQLRFNCIWYTAGEHREALK